MAADGRATTPASRRAAAGHARRPRRLRRWSRSRSSSCRTGPTTASTTGRCRSPGSRATTCSRSSNRVTWFPIVHDIFTRMWFTVVVGVCGRVRGPRAVARGCRRPSGCSRCGSALGALELLLHDVGNERRFVFLIPALVALAALVLGRERRLVPAELAAMPRATALARACRSSSTALYVVAGALARLVVPLRDRGRASASAPAVAVAVHGACCIVTWPRLPRCLAGRQWSPAAALLVAALVAAGQLAQFAQWAADRTYKNYEASRRARPAAAAGHARPRQARQRAGAREPASGRSSSAAGSATTTTGRRATMCDIF